MTENPVPLPTQVAAPSQTSLTSPASAHPAKEDAEPSAETAEEEPYTIKCICNFSDDDGNTIYCDNCDTWQHIDCFYPDNRDEAIREDFSHSCADCKPRPLNRQKAIERTLRLKNATAQEEDSPEKKVKRPPSTKNGKKRSKPSELSLNAANGGTEAGKQSNLAADNQAKKSKSSHKTSQSVSSQPSKRSPSFANSRSNLAHPPSPATTPPDLPDDFQIHHYSAGFYSLYNEHDVPDTHNNAFASLAIPTALSRWLREPDAMKQEVGRTHTDVFQEEPANLDDKRPKLEVKDATRSLEQGTTLRWRFVKSTAPIEKDVPLIELNGEIGFQKDYCADPENLWTDLSSPLPFVFFHPVLPLYIDTRKEGSLARYVRRSCKPNAQLDTYLSGGSEYHFWLVSDRYIAANEQITLPWDFRLEKSVCARWLHLLGLSDDESVIQDQTALEESEYIAISNWIDRMLSEYGGCACDLENNCAFARFHRHYFHVRGRGRPNKKKSRKSRNHTVSPTSTGQATNSRAASEGHGDEMTDNHAKLETLSLTSKPTSRDPTPVRQGSFDQLGILTEPTDRDKRKVAMVEDSFRRMEQQPPPRKKKRVSDGTSSSKSKARSGSSVSGGYVDAGTSRSKTGSPASSLSPSLPSNPFKSPALVQRPRQSSSGSRPSYCDAGVQTDPVEGEWFSEPCRLSAPKKRIIPLSRRLLNSRYRIKAEDTTEQKPTLTDVAPKIAMDIDVPAVAPSDSEYKDNQRADASQPDTAMPDAPAPPSEGVNGTADACSTIKTPDLRVQMPPVPTFDNSGLSAPMGTTPLSASSSAALSPFAANGIPSPFQSSAVHSAIAKHSPVKKKLSLSDYTKSRMKKGGTKDSSGPGSLKSTLSSPEDIKVEMTTEFQGIEKIEEKEPLPTANANGGI
ncbi:SET domain protein [Cordyceps fumosorosea ARSEF 2679]|uniref:SET domain protein n=1 Tax=Cordyceps fumosorosea (strain ARSEF 2679) TaxID=1081104 RepID=A0A167V982_CORFA|nr:SET domain protein [Cordyceps fumosorosea ARSEF 2679]OAA62366.1 SET domain protein [Cordyceps fumosorosea ARSEF 2679]